MLEEEDLPRLAKVFHALGNEVRLRILIAISESKKPLHIKGVAKSLKLDYTAVYRHVKLLKAANLIEVHEVGRSRVLALTDEEFLNNLLNLAK